jgi:hypothetical protein
VIPAGGRHGLSADKTIWDAAHRFLMKIPRHPKIIGLPLSHSSRAAADPLSLLLG